MGNNIDMKKTSTNGSGYRALSLSAQLTIFFTSIMTVILAGVIIFVSVSGSSISKRASEEKIDLALKTSKSIINTYLEGVECSLNNLIKDKELIDAMEDLFSIKNPETNELYSIKGVTDKVPIPSIKSMMNKFTNYTEDTTGIICTFLMTEKEDLARYPEFEIPDYSCTHKWQYKRALAEGSFWTDPYADIANGDILFTALAAVKDGDKTYGVLGVDVDMQYLTQQATAAIPSELGNLSIIVQEEDGYRVIYSSNEKVAATFSNKLLKTSNDKNAEDVLVNPKLVNAIKNNSDELISVKLGEEEYLVKMTNTGTNNWTILTAIHPSEFKSSWQSMAKVGSITAILLIIVCSIIGRWVINRLVKDIDKINAMFADIGKGDLTKAHKFKAKSLDVKYLSDGAENMRQSLTSLISEVKSTSDILSNSAQDLNASFQEASAGIEEITRNMEEISQGSTKQLDFYENCVNLTVDLSGKITSLSDNADSMYVASNIVKDKNEEGLTVLNELSNSSKKSVEAIDTIEKIISDLNEKTRNIQFIIDSISDIASQTNLLSLNASIEAARAGENGKGFSVVAEEVKKLAQQSSDSAAQIKSIIDAIQTDVEGSVNIMKEVKSISKIQNTSVNKVDAAFNSILTSNNETNQSIDTVVNLALEINNDKEKILELMKNMSSLIKSSNTSTQEITHTIKQQLEVMDESTNAAGKLNELALNLLGVSNKFDIE